VVVALGACGTAQKRPPAVEPPSANLSPAPLPVPPNTVAVQAAQTLIPDPVDVLIKQVEAAYGEGMDDYRAGNFDKAKEKFDRALRLLLESNLDLTADQRLADEFNKLVENIHPYEVASLENSETPTTHQDVPAPIESIAGLTFPVDPQVKERAQLELQAVHSDLPLVSNDYVDGVLTYFQGRGRGYIERVLKRLGAYQAIFSEALSKEGIPQDLVFLAAGESAFNPFARSNKGAKGIWQFMPGTGALYGLAFISLLRAYANGGSSLTGLEAISNGVASFRRPTGPNARKPGEGPSKEERENGLYDLLYVALAPDGKQVRASVKGDRDPGYGSTSKMISECAICLLRDAPEVPGGIWTPGAAMGQRLIKRLVDNAGLTFQVEA